MPYDWRRNSSEKNEMVLSYRIDLTEKWLEDLMAKGFHLKNLNRFSRVFTFEQEDLIKRKVRIHYGEKTLTSKLASAGWESVANSGKWQVLTNESMNISIFPSRDQLFKRTRLHSYMYFLISTFYLSFIFLFGIIFNVFSETFQIGPLLVPIIIYTGLIVLTIFVFRA